MMLSITSRKCLYTEVKRSFLGCYICVRWHFKTIGLVQHGLFDFLDDPEMQARFTTISMVVARCDDGNKGTISSGADDVNSWKSVREC